MVVMVKIGGEQKTKFFVEHHLSSAVLFANACWQSFTAIAY